MCFELWHRVCHTLCDVRDQGVAPALWWQQGFCPGNRITQNPKRRPSLLGEAAPQHEYWGKWLNNYSPRCLGSQSHRYARHNDCLVENHFLSPYDQAAFKCCHTNNMQLCDLATPQTSCASPIRQAGGSSHFDYFLIGKKWKQKQPIPESNCRRLKTLMNSILSSVYAI